MKLFFFDSKSLLTLTLLTSFSSAHAQNFMGSFTWSGNGHLYELYDTEGISFQDAMAFAVGKGGTLATVTSADENAAVTMDLGGMIVGSAYLGGSQPDDETDPNANWSWTTGEAWSYTSWSTGEPNDFNGAASEQFLEMYSDGTWNDIGANIGGYNRGFIVETVPEPTLLVAGPLFVAALVRRRRSRV